MDPIDEKRLRYRRQFLLSRAVITSLSHWNLLLLPNGLHIYSHPDLCVTHQEHMGTTIVSLGYLFDPYLAAKSNVGILGDILKKSKAFSAFLEAIKGYAGQYVFIYMDGRSTNVIHDPLGLREVYYCTSMNRIICGSQPNLVKDYSDPPLGITTNRAILSFYKHDLKKIRSGRFWVGDETYFSGIKHLLPNHYLDIHKLRPIRYWPREKLVSVKPDEAVEQSCSFLQSMLRAAAYRYELMIAVTSGIDSRTLLAASKGIHERIYYFINKNQHLNVDHPDIRIPSAIFKRLNIPFHIHNVEGEIDKLFKRIFLDNTFMSTDLNLPAIYNIYYRQLNKRLNVLGVGEIGRTFFGNAPRNINGYYLARFMRTRNSPYAVEECQKWLDNTLPVARRFGVNIMTLLLWEQLLGNWGAVGNSESDIAIEEFDPFNSHQLYETLLGVEKSHLKYGKSGLFNEMIRQMWPELLEFPVNPPFYWQDHLQLALDNIGLYRPLQSLRHKLDWIKFTFMRNKPN